MGAGNMQVVRKARPALGRESSLEIRVGPAHSSGSCDSWEQYGEKGEAETPLQGAATAALVDMESGALSMFAVGPGDRGAPSPGAVWGGVGKDTPAEHQCHCGHASLERVSSPVWTCLLDSSWVPVGRLTQPFRPRPCP